MKKSILLLCLISCLSLSCYKSSIEQLQTSPELRQQGIENTAQIFLVRHAEKSKNDPRDPDLSDTGKERAERLKYHLMEAGITKIYTTDYNRTRQTVQPLADALGIKPMVYKTDLEDITSILQATKTGNILVAGHSNTTPKLVNKLLGQEKYKSLVESEYNKLFLLNKTNTQFTSTVLQY